MVAVVMLTTVLPVIPVYAASGKTTIAVSSGEVKVGEEVFLDSMTIAPGATSVTIPLVGSGTVVYDLYYNGVYFKSETVEFDPDE